MKARMTLFAMAVLSLVTFAGCCRKKCKKETEQTESYDLGSLGSTKRSIEKENLYSEDL